MSIRWVFEVGAVVSLFVFSYAVPGAIIIGIVCFVMNTSPELLFR